MVGPFDEVSVVNFLFPVSPHNSQVQSIFRGTSSDWPDGYATLSEYHMPSMGIYVGERALEITWIGRVEYHNLMHDYDFQVHIVLSI